MKTLDKEQILKEDCLELLLKEKKFLNAVNFVFFSNLVYCFKDSEKACMLYECKFKGDTSFSSIVRYQKVSEKVCKFYAAQIVLALEYLHHVGIIYRDLAPENILVDKKGYIRISSFKLAKKTDERTSTFCGTPEYLAPEIILMNGYDAAVDWWALGVFIFEMTHGYSPFQAETPAMMYEDIILGRKRFRSSQSLRLRILLANILQIQTEYRYGCEDIKSDPWFRDINWESLFHKTLDSPDNTGFTTDDLKLKDIEEFTENAMELEELPEEKFAKEFQDF